MTQSRTGRMFSDEQLDSFVQQAYERAAGSVQTRAPVAQRGLGGLVELQEQGRQQHQQRVEQHKAAIEQRPLAREFYEAMPEHLEEARRAAWKNNDRAAQFEIETAMRERDVPINYSIDELKQRREEAVAGGEFDQVGQIDDMIKMTRELRESQEPSSRWLNMLRAPVQVIGEEVFDHFERTIGTPDESTLKRVAMFLPRQFVEAGATGRNLGVGVQMFAGSTIATSAEFIPQIISDRKYARDLGKWARGQAGIDVMWMPIDGMDEMLIDRETGDVLTLDEFAERHPERAKDMPRRFYHVDEIHRRLEERESTDGGTSHSFLQRVQDTVYKFGDDWAKTELGQDHWAYRDSLYKRDLMQGLGSFVAFIGSGLLTRGRVPISSGGAPLGLATRGREAGRLARAQDAFVASQPGAAMAAAMGRHDFDADAREHGADPETMAKARLIGAVVGYTQTLPLANALFFLRRPLTANGGQKLWQVLGEAGLVGVQESALEAFYEFSKNYTAGEFEWDPERSHWDNVSKAAGLGGAVGFLGFIVMRALTRTGGIPLPNPKKPTTRTKPDTQEAPAPAEDDLAPAGLPEIQPEGTKPTEGGSTFSVDRGAGPLNVEVFQKEDGSVEVWSSAFENRPMQTIPADEVAGRSPEEIVQARYGDDAKVTPVGGEVTPAPEGAEPAPAQQETPARAAPAEPADAGVLRIPERPDSPVPIRRIPASEIQVDAETYQFKDSGKDGLTDRLKGVERWNDLLGDRVIVHERADGTMFIADGHQRLGLAKRLEAQGHEPINLDAIVMREADGFSASDAMIFAAVKNIGNESGTAWDAAKIFRLADDIPSTLGDLPANSAIVRDGQRIAKLSDEAIQMALNNDVSPAHAGLVGQRFDDPAQQLLAVQALAKFKPASAGQASALLEDIATTQAKADQGDMFGGMDDRVVVERMKLIDMVRSMAAKDKALMAGLVRNKGAIEGKAKNVVDQEGSEQAKAEAEAVIRVVEKINTTPELNQYVTEQAEQVASGRSSRTEAARKILDRIKSALADAEGREGATEAQGETDLGGRKPTQAEQTKADKEAETKSKTEGSPDMLEGDGDLFAGPRPDQQDAFGPKDVEPVSQPADVEAEIAGMDPADVDAMLDNLDDDAPAQAPVETEAQADPETAPPAKGGDEAVSAIVKSLGGNMSESGVEAIKGLHALFGGHGKLSSGLTFDPETYAKAKPHFKAALAAAKAAGHDARTLFKTLVNQFGETIKPYIQRFADDLSRESPDGLAAKMAKAAEEFEAELSGGRDFSSIRDVRKFFANLVGEPVEGGTQAAKMMEEVVEQAGVSVADQMMFLARKQKLSPDQVMDQVIELGARLPNLNTRTSTSIALQQYSTPLPIAVMTHYLARVNAETDVLLDPTAGHGALLIGAETPGFANELDAGRASALRRTDDFSVAQMDATKKLPFGKVDVVKLNPPFGSVKDSSGKKRTFNPQGKYETAQIDHAITLQTLNNHLKDDGRAVIIVGGPMAKSEGGRQDEYRAKAKREFYYHLYNGYNVTDHFTIAGELYGQQGAKLPVDVIVVDGKGKSARALPAADLPVVLSNWQQLKEKVNEHAERKPGSDAQAPAAEQEGGVGAEGGAVSGKPDRGGDGADGGAVAGPGANVPAPDSGPSAATAGGRAGSGGRGEGTVRPAGRPEPDAGVGRPDGERSQPDDSGQRPDAGLSEGDRTGRKPAAESDQAKQGSQGDAGSADTRGVDAGAGRKGKRPVEGTERQVPYESATNIYGLDSLVPANMRDAVKQALASFIKRHGQPIDYVAEKLGYTAKELREKGYFADEQIDALALAIDNIEGGSGFVLGDQTGIGKGRVVAGVLRYAMKNGLTPIFVTEKPGLYKDIYRDLVDIGMPDVRPLMTDNAKKVDLDDDGIRQLKTTGRHGDKLAKMAGGYTVESKSDVPMLSPRYSRDEIIIGTGKVNNLRDLEFDGKGNTYVYTEGHIRFGNQPKDGFKSRREAEAWIDERLRPPDTRPARISDHDYDIIFTTYSQMQSPGGKMAPRHHFLQRFAQDSIIVFDESHNAGGTTATSRSGEAQAKTGRAGFARDMLTKAKGVMYSSATWAKRPDVMDLYAKTDLRLAVKDLLELGGAIAAGGVPMQQIISVQLVRLGQMIRRERSFKGINYNRADVAVSVRDAETISASMLSVHAVDLAKKGTIKSIKNTLDAQGKAYGEKGSYKVQSANFASAMHNLVGQMLLVLKVDAAVAEALDAIKAGRKPVITVANTMGSFIKQYADSVGVGIGEPLPVTFKDLMLRYLEKSRQYRVKDPDGKSTEHTIAIADMDPGMREAYFAAKAQIEAMEFEGPMPVSPIDYMIGKLEDAGLKVDEITGRTERIVYDSDGNGVYMRRPGDVTKVNYRNGVIKRFNETGKDGKPQLDVIILNQAGSTGLSLHASEKFSDQRPRTMIIAQAELNIDTHMQMLGRINRTGQVNKPEYRQLVAGVPAENRPAAVLFKKMASLNANTTAARGSDAMTEDVVDFMNELGDQVVAEILMDNPEVNRLLGSPMKEDVATDDDGKITNIDGLAIKATGKLPLLPIKQQKLIYDMIEANYKTLLEQMERMGQNPLEAKTLALDARAEGEPVVVFKGSSSDSPFAANATAQTYSVKRIGKPFTSEQVQRRIDKAEKPITLAEALKAGNEYWRAKREASGATGKEAGAQEAAFNAAKLRFQNARRAVDVGKAVMISTDAGTFTGVVLEIVNKTPEGGNPVAPGNWRVTFAVADAMRTLTVPMSRIGVQIKVNPAMFSMKDTLRQFDDAQSISREDRVIMTGNILAGMGVFKSGQIVSFTKSDGSMDQGILMPKSFELTTAIARLAVSFAKPQDAVRWMEVAGRAGILYSNDSRVEVRHDSQGGFELRTKKAKAEAGDIFLSPKVIAAAGSDFVSRGNSMRVTLDGRALVQTLQAITEVAGVTFEARTHKQEARGVLGIDENDTGAVGPQSSQAGDAMFSRGEPGPTQSTKADAEQWLGDIKSKLQTWAKLVIVQSEADLPVELARLIEEHGATGAKGVMWRNTAYVIADNVANAREAQEAAWHELAGHLGLRKLLGQDFAPLMEHIYLNMPKSARDRISQNEFGGKFDANQKNHRLRVAEEYVAGIAQTGSTPTIMERIASVMRKVLRRLGFNELAELGKAEIRQLVARSEVAITAGMEAAASEGLPGWAKDALSGDKGAADAVTPVMSRKDQPRQSKVARAIALALGPAKGGAFVNQTIDTILGLPARFLGGYNQYGQWKPGMWFQEKRIYAVTKWKPQGTGFAASAARQVMETIRAGVIHRHGQTPEYIARERGRQAKRDSISLLLGNILSRLENEGFKHEQYVALQRVLEGKEPGNEALQKLSKPIRNALDSLGFELVQLGFLAEETWAKNLGKYLHTSYFKYENELQSLPSFVRRWNQQRRAKGLMGDEFKMKGLVQVATMNDLQAHAPKEWWGRKTEAGKPDLALKSTEWVILDHNPTGDMLGTEPTKIGKRPRGRVYWPAEVPLPENLQTDYENRGTFEVVGFDDKGRAKLRRDYTEAEHADMGKVMDARFNLVRTFQIFADDISNGQFYRDIAKNPAWSIKRSEMAEGERYIDGQSSLVRTYSSAEYQWVRVPNTVIKGTNVPRWGAMSGRLVRPEIWRDLNHLDRAANKNAWDSIMTHWKLNKALALDTPLPTPDGWTTMGDIKAGDTLFDEKGLPCKVLEVKEIQHGRPCYRVIFSDGTSIVADEGHFWYTEKQGSGKVRTTKEILETLREGTRGDAIHSIPVAGSLETAETELPIDPYILGLWIGDGHKNAPRFTTCDRDAGAMIEQIVKRGYHIGNPVRDKRSTAVTYTLDWVPVTSGRSANGFNEFLKVSGLRGQKRIPDYYLRSSPEQRLELLRGLMDTDGWVTAKGDCGYGTSDELVRDGVMELLRSLGFKPQCHAVESLSGKTAYRIYFIAYSDVPCCLLPRKRERLRERPKTRQRSRSRQIVAVEPVESVPVRCIAVDSDSHLYLAGDGMIPTHNTARNPVVHMNNIMSNLVLMDLLDVQISDLVEGLAEYVEGGVVHQIAAQHGAYGGMFVENELMRKRLKPVMDELRKEYRAMRDDSPQSRAWFLTRMSEKIWSLAKKLDDGAVGLYQAEDSAFRLATFIAYQRKGYSAQEAAIAAADGFLNYDIRAPWVNAARRTLLPFISYTYRAAPAVLSAIEQRPWKFAKYITLYMAWNMMAYELDGGDEELERSTMRDRLQAKTLFQIPFTDIGVDRMVKMPWRDRYGQAQYLDILRWVPAGDVFDMHQSELGLPAWLQVGGPMMIAAELALNKQAFTREPIFDKEYADLLGSNAPVARDIGGFLWRSYAPGALFVPGTWHYEKIKRAALLEGEDMLGRQFSTPAAVAGGLGFKVQPHDTQMALQFRAWEIQGMQREMQQQITSLQRRHARRMISDREYERRMDEYQRALNNLQQRAQAHGELARRAAGR